MKVSKYKDKLQRIIDSEELKSRKIYQLNQLEVKHYKPLIKQLAYGNTTEEISILVMVLIMKK